MWLRGRPQSWPSGTSTKQAWPHPLLGRTAKLPSGKQSLGGHSPGGCAGDSPHDQWQRGGYKQTLGPASGWLAGWLSGWINGRVKGWEDG